MFTGGFSTCLYFYYSLITHREKHVFLIKPHLFYPACLLGPLEDRYYKRWQHKHLNLQLKYLKFFTLLMRFWKWDWIDLSPVIISKSWIINGSDRICQTTWVKDFLILVCFTSTPCQIYYNLNTFYHKVLIILLNVCTYARLWIYPMINLSQI